MLTPRYSGESTEPAPQSSQRASTPAIPDRNAAPTQTRQAPAKQAEQRSGPEYEFIISAARIQKDAKTATTCVKLKSADGKEVPDFAQGEHPLLTLGTMLTETKLSVRKQNTVTYYILESYRIVPPEDQAA